MSGQLAAAFRDLRDRRWLHRRYERKAEHFLAFAGIAAVLICVRRFSRQT
ncbi:MULTISPECIES: hypothetical protein [unclassified Streptomyces]|nr:MULTISPECIES: hypothetical protein [unclassified Streptomyces]MCX4992866.1 hypothetical protein [Streptomyces sp. NBC_00568]MCX5001898.1 hypothetical protein [Streptomyces sp. NBC_00638]